jgi:hypothetical protein
MSANLYASVAEFKDRMGITDTDRDFAIDRVLQSASRWIDRMTGRRFYTNVTPEIRYYTLHGAYWNPTYRYPYVDQIEIHDAQAVTELATDQNGDGVYETLWTSPTDYHLEPLNAGIDGLPYTWVTRTAWTGRFSFPTYPHAIRVTGTFGYSTLANCPPLIRELCMMVAEVNARPILDMTMPGIQTYKLGTEITVTMESKNLPSGVRDIVQEFNRKAYVV